MAHEVCTSEEYDGQFLKLAKNCQEEKGDMIYKVDGDDYARAEIQVLPAVAIEQKAERGDAQSTTQQNDAITLPNEMSKRV
ncbi:MAG: hypothetical protein M1834_002375 [Cirrosporium novae-zelandiae]|nr:MAG: hypothetical protein M1834_002375 [Cirrosporium novae-zelandiae]